MSDLNARNAIWTNRKHIENKINQMKTGQNVIVITNGMVSF